MLTLVPGGMGGSERYTRELARGLAAHPLVDPWAIVPASARGFSQEIPELVATGVTGRSSTLERVKSLAAAHRDNRREDWFAGADVVHYPFSVPLPAPLGHVRVVQTLHDVQHHDLPDMFSRAELLYRRFTYDRGARKADAVVTVSEFAKDRIVHHLGIHPSKVHVAHLGVSRSTSAEALGDREDFVLYPARVWPHKNHGALIRAIELLRRQRPTLRLVLTGGGLDALDPVPPWVERRGHVTDEELEKLFRRAACLAFPSLYEGFGLPPLEAMALGCPVAVSGSGALPEVCGDAAVYFDPSDHVSIASGVDRAISAGSRLIPLGLERARLFTWTRCVDAHVDVYRRLMQPAPT